VSCATVLLLKAALLIMNSWPDFLPITSCGLQIDDESVCVAVSMHLGINLCEPHVCRGCGSQVDARGLHCFTCKHAPGAQPDTSLSVMLSAGRLLLLASQP